MVPITTGFTNSNRSLLPLLPHPHDASASLSPGCDLQLWSCPGLLGALCCSVYDVVRTHRTTGYELNTDRSENSQVRNAILKAMQSSAQHHSMTASVRNFSLVNLSPAPSAPFNTRNYSQLASCSCIKQILFYTFLQTSFFSIKRMDWGTHASL